MGRIKKSPTITGKRIPLSVIKLAEKIKKEKRYKSIMDAWRHLGGEFRGGKR